MADEYSVFKIVNPPGTGPIIRIDNGVANARDILDFQKSSSEVFSVNTNGLPDPGGGDAKREIIIPYGDLPTDPTALEVFLYRWEKAATITNIYVALDTGALFTADPNSGIVVKNATAGATIATWVPTETLSLNTWQTLGAITNASIIAGAASYCYATFTKAGTGLAMSGLVFRIEYTMAG